MVLISLPAWSIQWWEVRDKSKILVRLRTFVTILDTLIKPLLTIVILLWNVARFSGWVPVRGFRCLFWRETYTKGLRARFSTRLEEDEGKQGPRSFNRRKQSTEVGGKVTVRERRLLSEEQGPWTQKPRMSQRSWWLYWNFADIMSQKFNAWMNHSEYF